MKRIAILLILSAVGCCLSAWAAAPPAGFGDGVAFPPNVPGVCVPGVVSYIVDGDTLDVQLTVVVRVRLLADANGRGCWSPESRTTDAAEKRLGIAAKENLKKIALGKPCLVTFPLNSIHVIDYMTMERLLAVVTVDGKSVGEQQIKSGHASSTKSGRLGK